MPQVEGSGSARLLSYTEISAALKCFASWDFAYGGRLAGSTLKKRDRAPQLSDGSAWGAAVQAWHSGGPLAELNAIAELVRSLDDDARKAAEAGFAYEPESILERRENLTAILAHYTATTERLPGLGRVEGEINVVIPELNASGTRFHCYLDAESIEAGRVRLVEYKLRARLTDRTIIERQPQYRWYAVARALELGHGGPVELILDERLKEAPKPPRIVQRGKENPLDYECPACQAMLGWACEGAKGPIKTYHPERRELAQQLYGPSHDTAQLTTPELYLAACEKYRVEPEQATVDALGAREWQQRVSLVFSPEDLIEGRRELVSAAQLIRDLDSGSLYPIRNGKGTNCRYCDFAGVCSDPANSYLTDSLFTRTEPKRLRGPRSEGVR